MPDKVTLHLVTSSTIASIGYDPETQALHVNFVGGAHYIYREVPKSTYDALLVAPSAGKFFAKNIRRVYEGVKV